MPERLLRILRLLDERTTAEELAEVLWLAQRVPRGENAPLALGLVRESAQESGLRDDAAGRGPVSGPALPPPQEETSPPELHAAPELPGGEGDARENGDAPPTDADDSDDRDDADDDRPDGREPDPVDPPPAPEAPRALSVRIAHPRSLSGSLATARALRPLKRYRPEPRRPEIDEAATAAGIAQTGLLDVVTRPGRERWLDLALVIDDSASMLLWQQLCTELHFLFRRLGAFRQIHTWGLRLERDRPPMLSPRPFGDARSLQHPSVIDDPSGRTMTLVVTDGAGAGWRTGAMEAQLARWGAHGPTAVIHALPARMWAGSALPARRWSVRVPHPGARNADWRVRDTLLPPELSPFQGPAVPVLEPSPPKLADWARVTVAGGQSTVLPLWDPRSASGPREQPAGTSAARAVRQFRRTASPEAYRLAAHLAAIAPLTVPVMRLVTEAVPWGATTAHLAEVFLGGLMRLAENTALDASALRGTRGYRHSQRIFSFTDEAGDILLDAVPTAEVVETARQVSRLIGELIGQSPEFPAWLNRPDGTDLLPEHARNFAWLGSALLRRLGLTGAVGAGGEEPPGVPEEKPRRAWNPLYPQAPFVGYSRRTGVQASWMHLPGHDPNYAGDYRLLGLAHTRGETNLYLGRDAYGDTATVRRAKYHPDDRSNASSRLVVTEASALARFDHRCLPRLLGHDPSGARPWTASSAVVTRSESRAAHLADVVSTTGPLGLEATLALAQRLAAALAHSHSAGVVHGHLSPRHILLTRHDPVVIGWHRSTVDGRPPQPDGTPARPADDLRALAAVLAYAALGNEAPAAGYDTYRDPPLHIDEAVWSESGDPGVDPTLHLLVARCLRGPSEAPPTAEGVLALLRDRMPGHGAHALAFTAWLSEPAVQTIGDAELFRAGTESADAEPLGAQVPVARRDEPTAAPSRVGTDSRKWLNLPGAAGRPPRKRKRLTRRPRPEVLRPRPDGAAGRCVAVIGARHGSGRSTVAVQLASALRAAERGSSEPVLMLPVHRRLGVFGYRLLDTGPPGITAWFPAPSGRAPSHARSWVTLADSRGAQFLYAVAPAQAAVRLDTWSVRRGIDWLRTFGTVIVDAAGTFLPPGDSLYGLLGDVDHLVMTTTTRREDLNAAVAQAEWLAAHGYERLAHGATVVVSDTEGTGGTATSGTASTASTARELFERRTGTVHTIPYDTGLHRLGLTDPAALATLTRRAYEELGRAVRTALRDGIR
ncbi:SAV_2336 N-terminal domain-related protein [Streptomyces sp. NPDC000987]|uniref:SAV_2336 N-terminal domain-related protein n=1 Tax=Streptomyces sp. NPDC000987 TaxID=3154374 RepID=UPI003332B9F4